jgi:hypothetical protein
MQKISQILINQIQSLTALTSSDFKKLYLSVIKNFSEILREHQLEQGSSSFSVSQQLENVILALKRRRAYLLPIGAESEVSFREREEWTYAVFIAGLLKGMDVSSKLESAQKIIPEEALLWLRNNSLLFSLLEEHLMGSNTQSIFSVILDEKKIPEVVAQSEKAVVEEVIFISEQEVKEAEIKLNPNLKSVSPELKVDDFFKWLKMGIENQSIPINASKGIVHRVQEGLLIVMLQAVEDYIQHCFKGQIRQHDREIFLTAIKKCDKLIRYSEDSLTHIYCVGRWEDREVITGFLMNLEDFFDFKIELPLNTHLSLDPVPAN